MLALVQETSAPMVLRTGRKKLFFRDPTPHAILPDASAVCVERDGSTWYERPFTFGKENGKSLNNRRHQIGRKSLAISAGLEDLPGVQAVELTQMP